MTTKTDAEQERADFEAWLRVKPCGAAHDFAWEAWQARSALASSEVQALRKDAERLDWLDSQAHCADWVGGEPIKRVVRADTGEVSTGDTWREAIDHARRIKENGE